jgi:ADP-ribose pyrophosphatase
LHNKSFDERLLSSKIVYKGKALKLMLNKVLLPTGRRTSREVIEHPGSVGVAPLFDDGKILLINQFRFSARKLLWEIPAGTLESGETPESCARRELEEETGYKANRLQPLFKCYLAPGYSTELMHFFIAIGLKRTIQSLREDEIISIRPISVKKAILMIEQGEIMDAKTICALSYLRASRLI